MKKHSKQQEQLNLLLSQEDIPANHFQLQERERVKTTLETSGQKCLDLSRNSNLYGFLQKMLKDTSNWAWTKYYMTWKAKTTPHKHLLFQLLVSVRTTKGKGYGLWATPNTMDHLPPREKEDCSSNQKNRKNRSRSGNLREQVVHQEMWPTPQLTKLVWVIKGETQEKKGTQKSLSTIIIEMEGGREKTTGQLNPTWVEWLMGFNPLGWIELEHSEIQSFPKLQKSLERQLSRMRNKNGTKIQKNKT